MKNKTFLQTFSKFFFSLKKSSTRIIFHFFLFFSTEPFLYVDTRYYFKVLGNSKHKKPTVRCRDLLDQTGDDVSSGQDTGAQNSQDVVCVHCNCVLKKDSEFLINHCRYCELMPRLNKTFNYVCWACTYHTYNNHNMMRHVRKHLDEKPFKCSFCNYRCRDRSHLKTHQLSRHSGNEGEHFLQMKAD
uniref:Zinc finger protein 711 n=1 Tax=Cacopsylla melanoneura TaxID=428564 RepID=A0A8D9AVV1_9HEMI